MLDIHLASDPSASMLVFIGVDGRDSRSSSSSHGRTRSRDQHGVSSEERGQRRKYTPRDSRTETGLLCSHRGRAGNGGLQMRLIVFTYRRRALRTMRC